VSATPGYKELKRYISDSGDRRPRANEITERIRANRHISLTTVSLSLSLSLSLLLCPLPLASPQLGPVVPPAAARRKKLMLQGPTETRDHPSASGEGSPRLSRKHPRGHVVRYFRYLAWLDGAATRLRAHLAAQPSPNEV
jgi:hypothetical protein